MIFASSVSVGSGLLAFFACAATDLMHLTIETTPRLKPLMRILSNSFFWLSASSWVFMAEKVGWSPEKILNQLEAKDQMNQVDRKDKCCPKRTCSSSRLQTLGIRSAIKNCGLPEREVNQLEAENIVN